MAKVNTVVAVEGLDNLRRTMHKAELDMTDMKNANDQVGRTVVSASQSGAPRRTGALAATARSSRAVAAARVLVGNSADVLYAGPIHWGWPAHNISAQPWVWNAAHETESEWSETYNTELQKIMDEVHGI